MAICAEITERVQYLREAPLVKGSNLTAYAQSAVKLVNGT